MSRRPTVEHQWAPAAPQLIEALNTLQASCLRTDGSHAFGEETLLKLGASHTPPRAIARTLTNEDGGLLGAALATRGSDERWLAELAIDPQHRHRGLSTTLIESPLPPEVPFTLDTLQVWSHSEHPDAKHLARRYGFVPTRQMWVMEIPHAPRTLQEPALPPGVQLRTFIPGRDEAALLKANREAFTNHPEQGNLDTEGLHARMRQEWFDPQGLFLAHNSDGELLGFHWTKLHRHQGKTPSGQPEVVGEIYVLGVVPQGLGLGRALARAGLQHLWAQGSQKIILYVEANNEAALNLYHSLGFQRRQRHTLYKTQVSIH